MPEVAILPAVQSFLDGGQRVLIGRDWLDACNDTAIDVVKAGIMGINTPMGADWDVPLGGYKQSGIGRENGRDGLELYPQSKTVSTAI